MKKYEIWSETSIGQPLEHDYDIIEKDGELIANRSNSADWTSDSRGNEVGKLVNSTDGFIITLEGVKKPIKLDYMAAYVLRCLLNVEEKIFKTEVRTSTVVKKF
jgi:hypothetical protein